MDELTRSKFVGVSALGWQRSDLRKAWLEAFVRHDLYKDYDPKSAWQELSRARSHAPLRESLSFTRFFSAPLFVLFCFVLFGVSALTLVGCFILTSETLSWQSTFAIAKHWMPYARTSS
jgi:hypothetical protein